MNLQPRLENDIVLLVPLKAEDFYRLYAVASDPLIWEQHPNPDRYKEDVFKNYFKGALESGGAFLILTQPGKELVGCTRFYDYIPEIKEVKIGYTFLARSCWGKPINRATKQLLLNYAFNHVDRVIFHVGSQNFRSQKAMEKLGAKKISEESVAYFGEPERMNFVYCISKESWETNSSSTATG